jgi:hypothetical protein
VEEEVRVLVACEFSGAVRDELIALGHDAVSCDILPSEKPGPHIQGDVLDHLNDGWDMLIAFPPCTHLCSSGARWWEMKRPEQEAAFRFVRQLAEAPIPRKAIENPVGYLSTAWRKPDQIIQPWQFGHGETKTTCLWLIGLPKLVPTNVVEGREARIHKMSGSNPNRSRERSRTYPGIAKAMAEQWTKVSSRATSPKGASDG